MKLKRNCLTILLLTILTMSFCYFHVKETYAVTYEFETGFEEMDPFGNWTEDPVEGYGYEIQTDIVHAGVNACRSLLNDGAMTYELDSDYTSHYSLVHFYINGTVPDGFGGEIFIRIWDIDITAYIETNASRGAGKSPYIRFYDEMNSDFDIDDTEGLALETWHTLEIYTEGDSGSANHKCWVNDRLIASVSDDTSGYNITGVSIETVYWSGAYDGRVFVDDFASNDDVPPEDTYYFNFNFKDLDSQDVELYVDWAFWNSTHDINYTEGEASLSGIYYLKTSKYEHLINTTTLDTATYGNSTIDLNLNMKRHQSCPNGFIVSNDTISSVSIYAETPQLLNFTIDGDSPLLLSSGVPKNASYILRGGENTSDWSYIASPSHIYFDTLLSGDEEIVDNYTGTRSSVSALESVHPDTLNLISSCGSNFHGLLTDKSYAITQAWFKLKKLNLPTCHIQAVLYNCGDDDKPSGEPLAFSDQLDASVLTTTLRWYQWNFTGADQYVMAKGTKYIIQCQINNDGDISETHRVLLNRGYASEDYVDSYYQLGEWLSYLDIYFKVYGKGIHDPNFALIFPSTTDPVVGPHTPMNNRVKVNVRLNGESLKGANVTVEGGPANRIEWALTDVFGAVKFKLKTGSYDIVASYEQHRKVKPVYVSSHMTIGIDLTDEDIIRDGFPEDLEDFMAWVKLPELDLSTETILVFILPLVVLVVYAVKKASEGPKRKWKYSYLE